MKTTKTITTALLYMAALCSFAQNTPTNQMEKLDRGIVAIPTSGNGNFVSWRFLGTDDESRTTFTLKRNGTVVQSGMTTTNFQDKNGNANSNYQVITYVNGEEVETSQIVKAQNAAARTLTLDRPAGGSTESGSFTYSPNDMSVGDVDGDGQYELFVKWDPSNSKDNSQDGYTGNVIIDCYKVDWSNGANGNGGVEKLWRIDLGRNIRAGAHYTQYMVYDFDGDGKAEMMLKTAPGSKDGKGNYVNQATTDENIKKADNTKVWLTSSGRMDGGHEYLTVFNGLTGEAIHTIAYNPNRNATSTLSEEAGTFNWAIGKTDTHGYNRGDRYLAAVAYLDGPDKPASGIFCRGYYSYAFIWAVDFDGKELKQKWFSEHRSGTAYSLTTFDADGKSTKKSFSNCKPTSGSGSGTMFQNGNHNMSIADVDGDGCDEIIWGSAALNNDGSLLYGTGFGHGDAIHLSDLDPDRPGLEVFQVHEEKGTYAWDVHDARTGEIIAKGGPSGVDNGRGMAAQLDANFHGFYVSSASAREQRSAATGEQVSSGQTSLNFRIYWDGDLQDELLDGTKIDKWGGSGTSRLSTLSGSTCNSTKNTPNLQADILGDWREEVILHNGADQIFIYSTTIATNYCIPTLMHDHTYRMGICWQNTAYNQPPHLGYYLPDAMLPQLRDKNKEFTVEVGQQVTYVIAGRNTSYVMLVSSIGPDGKEIPYDVPEGFTQEWDIATDETTISGTPTIVGDYIFNIQLVGKDGTTSVDKVIIHAKEAGSLSIQQTDIDVNDNRKLYDLQGRSINPTDTKCHGIYLIRQGNKTIKVSR